MKEANRYFDPPARPTSLELPKARALSSLCQLRQGPRLRLPTNASLCTIPAPFPRVSKFITLKQESGPSFSQGLRATVRSLSPDSTHPPSAPQATSPSLPDLVASSPAPISKCGDPCAAPSDKGLGAAKTSDSPAGRGPGPGWGREVATSKERRRPLQRRPRTRPRQAKWGGGSGNWGGWGRGQHASAKGQVPRWMPGRGVPGRERNRLSEGKRTTNPRMTRARPGCHEAPEEDACGRGATRSHRKRKPGMAFGAWEPGQYRCVLTGRRG